MLGSEQPAAGRGGNGEAEGWKGLGQRGSDGAPSRLEGGQPAAGGGGDRGVEGWKLHKVGQRGTRK